jgi:NADPH-dependent curcumin reductase CurA
MKPVNTQCRLAARPTGLPKATDFTIVDEPVPAAADGEFVVEIDYLSIDPAMRTWMNAGRSYVPPGQIGAPHGPANYMQLLVARASMTGFVIIDYVNRYPEGIAQLGEWLTAGKMRSHEQIEHGDVGAFPAALLKLFSGENTGKLILALQG